ncbi:hypothetical protein C6341_g23780 [Phytophthora cactorum]|nr:hypothetical protein C6341_g23780 [Phytophthora cactorum]
MLPTRRRTAITAAEKLAVLDAWMSLRRNSDARYWEDLLRDQLKRRKAGVQFKLVPPDRALIASWVEHAWAELNEKTVKAGYKRARLAVHEVEVVASNMVAELASLSLVDGRIGAVADEHDTIESSSLCDELLE